MRLIVLVCGACQIELPLSAEPVVSFAEVITFCAAHNGHNERLTYALTIPTPRRPPSEVR
jgi:hypothetical protein